MIEINSLNWRDKTTLIFVSRSKTDIEVINSIRNRTLNALSLTLYIQKQKKKYEEKQKQQEKIFN